jgi:hypothetical protein
MTTDASLGAWPLTAVLEALPTPRLLAELARRLAAGEQPRQAIMRHARPSTDAQHRRRTDGAESDAESRLGGQAQASRPGADTTCAPARGRRRDQPAEREKLRGRPAKLWPAASGGVLGRRKRLAVTS